MICSSQEILYKFICLIGMLKNNNEENVNEFKILDVFLLNTVINVLKELIGFIYECDYNKIASSGSNEFH